MKKHIVALITVLALLLSVLPMQAFAATFPTISVNHGTSTAIIEKGGVGRLSLMIERAYRSEERCAVVFVNSNGQAINEYTVALENTTTSSRPLTVTIDTAAMGLAVGEYEIRFWIESKNQATSRWELGPENSPFGFEVVNSRCGSNHTLKKVSEVKATCSQIGIVKYQCSVCDHVVLEETPMTDHKYELILSGYDKPTSSRAGEGTYVCQTCTAIPPASKIDIIPTSALGKITSQPKSVSVLSGKDARFTVVTTGMELPLQGIHMTYQWQTKALSDPDTAWSDISGADKAYYTITCNSTNHEHQFRCIVTDIFGYKVTSNAATLTMSDWFEITEQPQNAWAYDGHKATVRVKATGLGLTYQWYYKDPSDSAFEKSSQTTSTYSTTMNTSRDGRQVYCVVKDKYGNTETSDTVMLTIRKSLTITKQPEDVRALEDDPIVFSIIADTEDPSTLKYQWYYRNKGTTVWKESSCTDAVYPTTLTAERNGRQVYCKVTDGDGNTVTSRIAEMEIVEVAITQQPKSVSVYNGAVATFTVEAVGVDLQYQWYYKDPGDSDWTRSSSTSDTYSTQMKSSRNGRQVRCVITDKYGNTVTTNIVAMTMKATLAITGVSGNIKAYEGEKIKIVVTATGDGLKYAWYYKDVGDADYTKASSTTATYSLEMKASRDGRLVYCEVTDTHGGAVKSDVFKLDLLSKPTISISGDVTASADETVTFTATATGEGDLKYQWYYRNAGTSTWKMSSSTTDTLTTTMKPDRNGRQVRCVVTDEYGNKATSETATMRMPAVKITDHPDNVTVAIGENAVFKVAATGVGSLTYQWYYKNAGSSTWKASSSTTDTLTTTMKADRNGRQVRCVVTDENGSQAVSDVATMKAAAAVSLEITQHPTNQAGSVGDTVTFSVNAVGEGLTYQWYYKDADDSSWKKSSSTKSTYTLEVKESRDNRKVKCRVKDAYGDSKDSNTAKLTVN